MNFSNDPLREAILLELNRAIWTRRAQGASFEALRQEYGLSREALHLIAERDGWDPSKLMTDGDHGNCASAPLPGRS
jgi:hypothetical protein